jgi:hypothetical protein
MTGARTGVSFAEWPTRAHALAPTRGGFHQERVLVSHGLSTMAEVDCIIYSLGLSSKARLIGEESVIDPSTQQYRPNEADAH